jgi:hypothetical protein
MIKSFVYNKNKGSFMPQSQKQAHRSDFKIRQLFWTKLSDSNSELVPFLFIESRIDFNDVRTGFRETVSLNKALDLFNDADLFWTDDMIREIDPENISVNAPAGASMKDLPDFIDEKFIPQMELQFMQYLVRRFEAKVYRNSILNIYSFSGETLDQFTNRCLELLDGSLRQELGSRLEIFNRKMLQIKQKYLRYEDDPRESEIAAEDSQNRDVYSRIGERIAELFLRPELIMQPSIRSVQDMQESELQDCLQSLELEAAQAVAKLWDLHVEQARSVDEYILHPNLKDIHLVRTCILWLPKQ